MKHVLTFTALILTASGSALAADNFYGAVRINSANYKAHDMDSSARPGLGQFVPGDDSRRATGGSLALGYQLPSDWRLEAEYTLPRSNEFTSGSTRFPTSFNHHSIRSQRLMINAYKDFPLNAQFSVYGTAGPGPAPPPGEMSLHRRPTAGCPSASRPGRRPARRTPPRPRPPCRHGPRERFA